MPTKLSKDKTLINKAYKQVKIARTAHDLRLGLSILLLNQGGLTLKQAGELMGKNSASVSRYRVEFMEIGRGGSLPRKNWGGRRFGNLTPEKEEQLLFEFKSQAAEGKIVTASLIRSKYEQEVKKSVPLSTVTRMLERHLWRKVEPEPHHPKRDEAKEDVFKKKDFPISIQEARSCMGATPVMRVLFQDEARFGRMMEPYRCWAPMGMRPQVARGWVREYTYSYATVDPVTGDVFSWMAPTLDSENVERFLKKISDRYKTEEVLIVWDGARAHSIQNIEIPKNLWFIQLPPYSPRLNPVENFWGELREKYFHNHLFESMEELKDYLKKSMREFTKDLETIKSLAGFDWIYNAITLNAN